MKRVRLFIAAALFAALFAAAPANATETYYRYAHFAAEYGVDLPDAPTGKTLWAGKDEIPYLDKQPRFGAVGEVATLKRVDTDTGDGFSVEITFLHATRDFLLSLTEDKMKQQIMANFKDNKLDKPQFSFSKGNDTLKWAVQTGYTVDESNNLMFNSVNYLAGTNSIMIIKVAYNVEEKQYEQYYQHLEKSISYIGK